MPIIEVRGIKQVEARLKRAGVKITQTQKEAVQVATIMLRNEVFKRMSAKTQPAGFWGVRSPEGPFLGVRSGTTRRALSPGRVTVLGNEVVGVVGHPSKHVAFLEEGGLISAKGQYLRIPTAEAMTPSGVDRLAGRSAKGVAGLFIITSKAKRLWIVARDGSGPHARLKLMYLLVNSVRIEGKHIFKRSLEAMRDPIGTMFRGRVKLALREVAGGR